MKTEFPLLTLRGRISVILNGAYWVLALGDAVSTVVGKLMVVVLPTTSRAAPNLLLVLVLVPGFDNQSAPMSRKGRNWPKPRSFPDGHPASRTTFPHHPLLSASAKPNPTRSLEAPWQTLSQFSPAASAS